MDDRSDMGDKENRIGISMTQVVADSDVGGNSLPEDHDSAPTTDENVKRMQPEKKQVTFEETHNQIIFVDYHLKVEEELKTRSMRSSLRTLWNKLIWHGGSVNDAWMTSSASQAGQVLLTLPTSYAQMGYGLGVSFQLLYASVGCWTSYLLASLYQEYRQRRERDGDEFSEHVIQYHEIMGYLVGKWAKYFSLFFNILAMSAVALSQITACSSTVHILHPDWGKRNWTLIVGGASLITSLVPTVHNYRILSILAVFTATYTSWYMTVSALVNGQISGVEHTGATDLRFFTGTTNVLFAFSAHTVSVETMHAMWKPEKYNYTFIVTTLYVLTITIPHSLAIYWAYGDQLLNHSNALELMPDTVFRSVAVVCMVLHQVILFGLFTMPLNLMVEKAIGVHKCHLSFRWLVRFPVAILIWFFAVAFPFLGPTNSVIGSLVVSFSAAIIPCLMYILTFRTQHARKNSAQQPTRWLPGWQGTTAVNIGVITGIAILGVGIGGWASITDFVGEVKTFGLFTKCYKCT